MNRTEDVTYKQEQPSCPISNGHRTAAVGPEEQTSSAKNALLTVVSVMLHGMTQTQGVEIAPGCEISSSLPRLEDIQTRHRIVKSIQMIGKGK